MQCTHTVQSKMDFVESLSLSAVNNSVRISVSSESTSDHPCRKESADGDRQSVFQSRATEALVREIWINADLEPSGVTPSTLSGWHIILLAISIYYINH